MIKYEIFDLLTKSRKMDIIGGNDLFFLFIDTLQCYRLNYKELMDDGTIKERMDRCILMLEDSYKIMKSLINMSYESGKFVFKINRFGVERY